MIQIIGRFVSSQAAYIAVRPIAGRRKRCRSLWKGLYAGKCIRTQPENEGSTVAAENVESTEWKTSELSRLTPSKNKGTSAADP